MKNEPKSLPSRYLKRFNTKKGEWEVKKKYRFTDSDGKVRDTNTKWHNSIEECEKEARLKVEGLLKNPDVVSKKEITIKSALKTYVEKLKKEADKTTNVKNSTAVDIYHTTNSLYNKYTPETIGNVSMKNLTPDIFSKWVGWINSDTVGHDKLSGIRIRALKNRVKAFASELTSNGLMSYETYVLVLVAIKDQRLKRKTSGKRNDRYMPTFDDLQKIKKHYRSKKNGLGEFNNFYWYTFWIVLFCSGMRVGEIIALQWRDITFAKLPKDNVIHINNAISEKEKRENEMAIIKANNKEAKNKYSKRNITMWAYYRELFKDYKHSYRCWYGFENYEDMEDNFVFPNITSMTNTLEYQPQRNILRELNRVASKVEMPKTDAQMFRHACAYFLAYEQGYSIEDTHDYFGHADSTMIREVYAPLNAEEKRKKQAVNHHSLITEEEIYFDEKHSESAERVKPSEQLNRTTKYAKREREIAQIKRCIKNKQANYYYPSDYAEIIQSILNHNPEFMKKMNFIEEKE